MIDFSGGANSVSKTLEDYWREVSFERRLGRPIGYCRTGYNRKTRAPNSTGLQQYQPSRAEADGVEMSRFLTWQSISPLTCFMVPKYTKTVCQSLFAKTRPLFVIEEG